MNPKTAVNYTKIAKDRGYPDIKTMLIEDHKLLGSYRKMGDAYGCSLQAVAHQRYKYGLALKTAQTGVPKGTNHNYVKIKSTTKPRKCKRCGKLLTNNYMWYCPGDSCHKYISERINLSDLTECYGGIA